MNKTGVIIARVFDLRDESEPLIETKLCTVEKWSNMDRKDKESLSTTLFRLAVMCNSYSIQFLSVHFRSVDRDGNEAELDADKKWVLFTGRKFFKYFWFCLVVTKLITTFVT